MQRDKTVISRLSSTSSFFPVGWEYFLCFSTIVPDGAIDQQIPFRD